MASNKLLSAKYLYALELVARLFSEHKRAIGGVPYITHLVAVCHIVEQLTDDENVHLAALLHDVLEDIPASQYGVVEMKVDFGAEVLQIVQTVSHDDARYGKDEARRRYLQQLEFGSLNACLVSGADMLDNGTDLIYWYEREPAKLTDC
ncbi:MAG: HD domain-containing protein, partial [Candidatus Saccharimonadales bacterium]